MSYIAVDFTIGKLKEDESTKSKISNFFGRMSLSKERMGKLMDAAKETNKGYVLHYQQGKKKNFSKLNGFQ